MIVEHYAKSGRKNMNVKSEAEKEKESRRGTLSSLYQSDLKMYVSMYKIK